jgi:hypothetical protein
MSSCAAPTDTEMITISNMLIIIVCRRVYWKKGKVIKIPITVIQIEIDCRTKGIKSKLFLFCFTESFTGKSSLGKILPEYMKVK